MSLKKEVNRHALQKLEILVIIQKSDIQAPVFPFKPTEARNGLTWLDCFFPGPNMHFSPKTPDQNRPQELIF